MYVAPTAPRTIGGVLDDGLRLFRHSFASLLPIAFVAAVLAGTPGIYIALSAGTGNPQAILELMKLPRTWLVYLAFTGVYLGFFAALVSALNTASAGERISLGTALSTGLRRLLPMLSVAVLFTLMIGVGTLLLLIPGIYLWGIFQLAFIAVVVEDVGVFASFAVSRRLIKGHWWRSATILTVAFVILIVFSMIGGLVGGLTAGVLKASSAVSLMLQQVITIVLNILLLPLIPAVYVAMYRDLKLRTEGDDLAARVDALPAR